jgi:hypothetical protein
LFVGRIVVGKSSNSGRTISMALLVVSIVATVAANTKRLGAVEISKLVEAANSITADKARTLVGALADDTFEGREAGSRGGRAAGLFIVGELKKIGAAPAGLKGSYYQAFGGGYSNILSAVEGSDPELKKQWIVVSAHYDHVGYGTRSNSYGPIGTIHNGADDNASGVAGLLEIVAAVKALPEPPKRSILFALWDGEEKGLLGSKHWTREPTVPLAQLKLMINADMIGRLRGGKVEVLGSRTCRGLRRLVSETCDDTNLFFDFSWELKENSDHHSFFSRQVPVLMFFTGLHNDYHRPSDDAERVNVDGLSRIARLTFKVLVELADRPSLAGFRTASRGESPYNQQAIEQPLPPLPGRLGLWWDEKLSGPEGIVVTRVVPGTPAAQAAVRVGDRIVQFAGQKIASVEAFRSAVQVATAPAEATIERAGQAAPLKVALQLIGKPTRLGITWREDDAEPGVVILNRVTPGSPAATAGLRVHDRIYQIGGQDFADGNAFRLLAFQVQEPVELLVESRGQMRMVTLTPPESLPAKVDSSSDNTESGVQP